MVDIDTRLTGNVELNLDKFESAIKQKVLFSGVAAMAKVMYDEVQLNASRHVKTGKLLGAVYRAYSPEKSDDAQKVYHVSVNKKKAPHWSFLENGTSRQPATPFIRPALDRLPDAIKAGNARMAERFDEVT